MDEDQDTEHGAKNLGNSSQVNQSTIAGDAIATDGSGDQVRSLVNVEAMINSALSRMQRIKEDLKPIKEMVDSYLENDEEYDQLVEVFKKASKAKRNRKKELLATDNGQELKAKMDALKEERKEAKEQISYYLREYQRLTGTNEIETDDGELREIRYTARLVRKR